MQTPGQYEIIDLKSTKPFNVCQVSLDFPAPVVTFEQQEMNRLDIISSFKCRFTSSDYHKKDI